MDLGAADEVPATGWKQVLEGQDENGHSIVLIHADSAALRRMAVFDAVVNNAGRRGDHILAMGGGHRYGVDHGLTFHGENKLQTVLWGWVGDALSAEELEGVDRFSPDWRVNWGSSWRSCSPPRNLLRSRRAAPD